MRFTVNIISWGVFLLFIQNVNVHKTVVKKENEKTMKTLIVFSKIGVTEQND